MQDRKQNTLQNALSKFSPTMCTLAEELSNWCEYFLKLSGFLDLFGKVFLIVFKFSLFESLLLFCNSNAKKTV